MLKRICGPTGLLAILLALALCVSLQTPRPVRSDSGTVYTRTLTIDSGQVSTSLTNFPLLVSLQEDSLKSRADGGHVAEADGADIYFTDSSGSVALAYEIESYTAATGALVAWVRVPTLADGSQVHLYYGGGRVESDPAEVWSNKFQGVWHMQAADAPDSTDNANHGTAYGDDGAITSIAGLIGPALDFDPGATYIDCGSAGSLGFNASKSYTWEGWINWDGAQSGGSGIFTRKTNPCIDGQGYSIYMAGGGGGVDWEGPSDSAQFRIQSSASNIYSVDAVNAGPQPGIWQHLAVTYDNTTVRMYLNGEPIEVLTVNGEDHTVTGSGYSGTLNTTGSASDDPFLIGWNWNAPASSDTRSHWNGALDELRYSSTRRSDAWILTGYLNQVAPEDFYSLGEETSALFSSSLSSGDAETVYGGTLALTATLTGGGAPAAGRTLVFSLNGTPVGEAETDASGQAELTGIAAGAPAAGLYPDYIRVSFAGDANYSAVEADFDLTVNPAVLTVQADDISLTVGASLPELTWTILGFVNAEDSSIVSGTPLLSTPSDAPDSAGTYPITVDLNDLNAANYTFSAVDGVLTVKKASSGGGGGGGGSSSSSTTVALQTSGFAGGTSLSLDSQGTLSQTLRLASSDSHLTLDCAAGTRLLNSSYAPLTTLTCALDAAAPDSGSGLALVCAFNLGPDGARFSPELTLTFSYSPDELPAGTAADTLCLAWYDGTQWQPLTSRIDQAARTVSASISHFSLYGLLVSLPPETLTPSTTLPESTPATSASPATTAIETPYTTTAVTTAVTTTATPTLSTATAAAGYYRTLTIKAGQVPSPLADFPLLVELENDPDLKTVDYGGQVRKADGGDIFFTDFSGETRYSHEIDLYEGERGNLAAWVKLPEIADGTRLKMWYGSSSVPDPAPSETVWSNGFQGVWHMGEADAQDSSSFANHGTAAVDSRYAAGAPAISTIAGQIGTAQYLQPGATYIDCGSDASLDFYAGGAYTWETWVNPQEFHSGGSGIIGKEPGTDYTGYDVTLGGKGSAPPGRLRFQTSGGASTEGMLDSSLGMEIGLWNHIAVVFDHGTASTYINGVFNAEAPIQTADDTGSPLYFGWKRNSPVQSEINSHFWGGLDEISLSATARSADWILARYRNQSDPSAFYSISTARSGDQPAYTLTVLVKGRGQVYVYPDQSDYPAGTEVKISATAEQGWSFAGWTGADSHDNTALILMDADKTVIVTFTEWGTFARWFIIGAGALAILGVVWMTVRKRHKTRGD